MPSAINLVIYFCYVKFNLSGYRLRRIDAVWLARYFSLNPRYWDKNSIIRATEQALPYNRLTGKPQVLKYKLLNDLNSILYPPGLSELMTSPVPGLEEK